MWSSRVAVDIHSGVVLRIRPAARPTGRDGRLELSSSRCSSATAQGLRTGKLYQSRDADIDGLETNFFSGAEMGGTEEPCYEINPVMFCADDENCGHVHLDIVDVYEEMPCDGEREY